MKKSLIFIISSMISSFAFACDSGKIPTLKIERLGFQGTEDRCTNYMLVFPRVHQNMKIDFVRLIYGGTEFHNGSLEFNADLVQLENENERVAGICATLDWLSEARVRVDYSSIGSEGNRVTGCYKSYEYMGLKKYVPTK